MDTWLWWELLLLPVLIIVGVMFWFMPRYREKRFLKQMHSEDTKDPGDEAAESSRRIREKFLHALRTLENSPDLKQKAGIPLYALPWYLLIGAPQAGKTALLHSAAKRFTPFARPASSSDNPTQDCDWWFFNSAIVLDATGRYAFPTEGERDSKQWYRLLQLLRYYRELQPINGVIVAVGADTLAEKPPEALRLEAAELRKRLDEATRELGVAFPVYLLLTRCDLIEGFTEFFACFPERTWQQVFGCVNASPSREDAHPPAVLPHFESLYAALVERLEQLRLTILNEEQKPPTSVRQKVFCFPEECRALQQPLSTLVETLFAENPYQHTPYFRGFFFCSALQQGTPFSFVRRQLQLSSEDTCREKETTTYFLHDLLAVVLPRDQYLVRPTGKATRGRLLKHLFGLGGCLLLCLFVVIFLTQAFLSDQRILSAVDKAACAAGTQSRLELRLEQVARCQHVVLTLTAQNHQRHTWNRMIFNHSGKRASQLRQRYVQTFKDDILPLLDAGIEPHLAASADTIPLVFMLLQRVELINQCLSRTGCPIPLSHDG